MAEHTDADNRVKAEEALSKEEQIEKERQTLWERVSSFDVRTITHKVAWILNHYPETRDSDITLQLKYWTTFQSDLYSGGLIDPDNLYNLARLTSLKRARAKIQNEYRLFQASAEVQRRRGTLAKEERGKAVEDKPVGPLHSVYMDDSGKHSDYLIVGSVWLLADFQPIYSKLRKLNLDFGKEFHFADATRQDEPWYKRFTDALYSRADAVSFKYVSIPRSGLKGNDPYTDLYYHLLIRGIRHETETGRAPLPRRLQGWIDEEGEKIDLLRLVNLEDRLEQAAASYFNGELVVDKLTTVGSKGSPPVQAADLIAASVNRVLNRTGTRRNHKDSIADYACEKLGLDPSADPNDQVGDMAIHIAL